MMFAATATRVLLLLSFANSTPAVLVAQLTFVAETKHEIATKATIVRMHVLSTQGKIYYAAFSNSRNQLGIHMETKWLSP